MAKLSARGRKELARVCNTVHSTDPTSLTSERRYTRALMSDNTILGKIDVIFKADGSKHCYGWKIVKKDAGWVSAEQFTQAYLEKGWVLG